MPKRIVKKKPVTRKIRGTGIGKDIANYLKSSHVISNVLGTAGTVLSLSPVTLPAGIAANLFSSVSKSQGLGKKRKPKR